VGFNKLCNPEEASLYTQPSYDENYYTRIAVEGYSLTEDSYRQWSTLPFSPGYPALLRGFFKLTRLQPEVARLVLSSILFLIACVGLDILYRTFSHDPIQNSLAIALFVFWPGSFYFLSGYAEALYLPLAVWCLVCLRKRWFLAASALASFALFTRSPAIILAPTICIAAAWDLLRRSRDGDSSLDWRSTSGLVGRLCAYGLICGLGLAAYVLVIWVAIGDPWAFIKSYDAWGAATHQGFDNYKMTAGLRSVFLFGTEQFMPVMLGIPFFLAMPLIVFPLRTRLPADLVAFTMIGWLFLLDRNGLQDPFIDILRWSTILFPVHYCLAMWILRIGSRFRSSRDATSCLAVAMVCCFGGTYAWFLTRFIHGEWVS